MILRKLLQKIIKQHQVLFFVCKFGYDFNKSWSNRLFGDIFMNTQRGTPIKS